MTVGRYGTFTVQQARERALKALVEAQDGKDPLADRREARNGLSVREFSKLYMDRHARPHKKSWREDQRRLDRYVIPRLGNQRLDEVSRAEVVALHTKLGQDAPFEANRVLALVSVLFNKAVEWGFLDHTTANPAAKVKAFREPSRERWIKPSELPRLLEAIDEEENPYYEPGSNYTCLPVCADRSS